MIYNYTKEINSSRLTLEIQQSSITVALDYIETVGDALTVYFKANLSEIEETELDALVTAHVNTALVVTAEPTVIKFEDNAKTPHGLPKFASYEPEGESTTLVSHNFGDKSSWYQGAVQVTDETLTNSSGNIYVSPEAKTHWIDLKHGRIYNEDNILAANPTYHPVIKIDGVTKVEATDYSINYATGEVTFVEPVSGVVTASYRYADKSWFIVKPDAGKILSIRNTEVQFSVNTVLNSPFYFEAWVNHPQFGYIAVPGSRLVYKNAKDFISSGNGGQGVIKAWGELVNDVLVFPFNYARPKSLTATSTAEIRIFVKDHVEVNAEYATATFYVTSESE